MDHPVYPYPFLYEYYQEKGLSVARSPRSELRTFELQNLAKGVFGLYSQGYEFPIKKVADPLAFTDGIDVTLECTKEEVLTITKKGEAEPYCEHELGFNLIRPTISSDVFKKLGSFSIQAKLYSKQADHYFLKGDVSLSHPGYSNRQFNPIHKGNSEADAFLSMVIQYVDLCEAENQ